MQIQSEGIENFRQTVATNYYTFTSGILSPLGKNLIDMEKYHDIKISIHDIVKKHDIFNQQESILYNIMTAVLYRYVQKEYSEFLLGFKESLDGNAPYLSFDGQSYTQDGLSSLIEYAAVINDAKYKPSVTMEIGAGSGRTAEFFLKTLDMTYVICDIPPALYVSQYYLGAVFPDKKIMKFDIKLTAEKLQKALTEADLIFIQPKQLNLLGDKSIDLLMAIDCLHEMKKEQVALYFDVADRVAKNFYFKAWLKTEVPFDEVTHEKGTYPVKTHWEEIYSRNCFIPADFFEAYYRLS